MKITFIKKKSLFRPYEVCLGEFLLGFLSKDNDVWCFDSRPITLTAAELRAIADRLDELNGVGK